MSIVPYRVVHTGGATTFWHDEDADAVFVPLGLCGDALEAVLCLSHDGISYVRDADGNIGVPAAWAMRVLMDQGRMDLATLLEEAEANLRRSIARRN